MQVTEKIGLSQNLFVFLACGLGCLACFYLQKHLLLPSFLASASVGFAGSFLPKSPFYNFKRLIACVYTGSFAAMCSLSFFSATSDIFILCFIVGIYFIVFSPYLKGIGGKLGTIGFISSLTFIVFKRIF